MNLSERYSEISHDDLTAFLQRITAGNPNIGYRSAKAHLQSRGIKVQFERVRCAMIEINAAAVALRWGATVRRRSYNVSTPNALWHIDGHHKLIR